MRRVLGFLLMASVLRLTAFDGQTECERHAADAPDARLANVGHEHHQAAPASADQDRRPDSQAPSGGDSVPKCCVVTGTCGGSTLAGGVVSRVSVGDVFAITTAWALNAPRTLIQAPEPPPPKA